jgi:hypothetical protein
MTRARAAALVSAVVAVAALVASCETDYVYLEAIGDRVDIHEVVEDSCTFETTEQGWEQYSCVPVFSNDEPAARPWERVEIGNFDIVQREIFGAPFYQMWYSGLGGTGPNDGMEIGYAVSMDGMNWTRHPWNPVIRRGTRPGSWDRDDASVACVAFDGDAGIFHMWYLGTNTGGIGTTFGHATSLDGVLWDKDLFSPLDPFEDSDSPLSRVWGCDALYEDGLFHFWVGGINWAHGLSSPEEFYASAKYDLAYLTTVDGAHFDGDGDLVLEHSGMETAAFDAEGVHKPTVFTWGDDEEGLDRYWMLYAGYNDVIATPSSNDLIDITAEGQRLGMASSPLPGSDWERLSDEPVPLDFSGSDTADSPRAFFINGRLHVFFVDRFIDPLDGDEISGIGLGISPFPIEEEL